LSRKPIKKANKKSIFAQKKENLRNVLFEESDFNSKYLEDSDMSDCESQMNFESDDHFQFPTVLQRDTQSVLGNTFNNEKNITTQNFVNSQKLINLKDNKPEISRKEVYSFMQEKRNFFSEEQSENSSTTKISQSEAKVSIDESVYSFETEKNKSEKAKWNTNGKYNDLILIRLAKFQRNIYNKVSASQFEEIQELSKKLIDYLELVQDELKRVSADGIVNAMLILISGKVGIGKKVFKEVLENDLKKSAVKKFNFDRIKKNGCYMTLKKGFKEILKFKECMALNGSEQ